ncbi:hypothetical protein Tco_1154196 [Tanacetum coccineum]
MGLMMCPGQWAAATCLFLIGENVLLGGCEKGDLSFKVDEIIQAWNDMYDVKRWQTGVPSFRLEPLFRRWVSKLHTAMEHF